MTRKKPTGPLKPREPLFTSVRPLCVGVLSIDMFIYYGDQRDCLKNSFFTTWAHLAMAGYDFYDILLNRLPNENHHVCKGMVPH